MLPATSSCIGWSEVLIGQSKCDWPIRIMWIWRVRVGVESGKLWHIWRSPPLIQADQQLDMKYSIIIPFWPKLAILYSIIVA